MYFDSKLSAKMQKRLSQNPNIRKLEGDGILVRVWCYCKHTKTDKIACIEVLLLVDYHFA